MDIAILHHVPTPCSSCPHTLCSYSLPTPLPPSPTSSLPHSLSQSLSHSHLSVHLIAAAIAASTHRILSSSGTGGTRGRGGGIVRLVTKGDKQLNDYLAAAKKLPDQLSLLPFPSSRDTAATSDSPSFPSSVLDETEREVGGEGGEGGGEVLEGVVGVAEEIKQGLLVREGLALRGSAYTQGLLAACRRLGCVTWHRHHVSSLSDLLPLIRANAYGTEEEGGRGVGGVEEEVVAVVVTTGAATVLLPELSHVRITPVRAQNIMYEFVGEGSALDAHQHLQIPIISGRSSAPTPLARIPTTSLPCLFLPLQLPLSPFL